MKKVRTVVNGALGKMGQVLVGALQKEGEIELVGGVDVRADEKLNMLVEQLNLSVRTRNCLYRAGITTVGEILSKGAKELIKLRNFGQNSKQEIEERLKALGLSLSAEPEEFLTLVDSPSRIPVSSNLESILKSVRPDVLADFTVASAVVPTVRTAVKYGINLVIGTTGLKDDQVKEIGEIAKASNVGAMVAPNFALGAVLMMQMAKFCSKYFDMAEIIELHHDQKLDAPSGTALATARMMVEARGKPFLRPAEKESWPSRGQLVDGINVHSVRLQGYVAHQEVIFGGLGQTLTIRHDSTGRDSFLPGIILAIKEIGKHKGLVYGLDALLGL